MDRTVPAGAALLLEFVYETETSRTPPQCYDVIYAHKQDRLEKPLTRMTVDEVIAAQRKWSRHHGSSAAGAPQFIRATLIGLKEELSLRGTQVFNGDLQDRLAYHLLIRRGYHQFVNGEISRTEFGRRVAQEWASFPVLASTSGRHGPLKRGQSYYDGDNLNSALVSPEKVEEVLDRVYATAKGEIPVRPVPVEVPGLDKPMPKSTTTWVSIITGVLGSAGAFLANLHPIVQGMLIVGIFAGVIWIIKERRKYRDAQRDIVELIKSTEAP